MKGIISLLIAQMNDENRPLMNLISSQKLVLYKIIIRLLNTFLLTKEIIFI